MFPDLRFAFRQLVKSPGFTLTVVATLALGISSCTVIYSILDRLVINPVSGAEPARRVRLLSIRPGSQTEAGTSLAEYRDFRAQAKSFDQMAAVRAFRMVLTGTEEPRQFFVLGRFGDSLADTIPILGRQIDATDNDPGRDKVVALGERLWRQAFGGDPTILGREIILNDEPYTVIGVVPNPRNGANIEAHVPFPTRDVDPVNRSQRSFAMTARLKPGVSITEAQAEMNLIAGRIAREHPATNEGWTVRLIPLAEFFSRDYRLMLWTLFGAVACVLLIACGNIASLLLARATVRQREISIRAALGASRGRLVRQLLTESLLLAAIGGLAGIFLASWSLDVLRAIAPHWIQLQSVAIDGRVMAISLVASLATGVLFGLVPAWLASRTDLNEALKSGSRGSTEGGASGWLRSSFLAIEIGGAVVLLAAAGLLIRSFQSLASADPGFTSEQRAYMRVLLTGERYASVAQCSAFADSVLEKLRALPGYHSAAASDALPIIGGGSPALDFTIFGRDDASRGELPRAAVFNVSDGYFRTMGIRLLAGREFTPADDARAPRVVVISEKLARQHFPEGNAVGQRVYVRLQAGRGASAGIWREIVGVVADCQDGRAVDQTPVGQLYVPHTQNLYNIIHFVMHTNGDPVPLLSAMKQQSYAVDPRQVVLQLGTVNDGIDLSIAQPRLTMQLLGAFAGIALVIASIGVYGMMAYNVSQRTVEIGIRMALGASRADVLRETLRRGMKIVAAGLFLGLVSSLALSHFVQSMLYRVSARDPLTLAAISGLLAAVAFLACWIPARRATKVDPMVALRTE